MLQRAFVLLTAMVLLVSVASTQAQEPIDSGIVGTVSDDILAAYHPDFPGVCRVAASEQVLAVGIDADRELVQVYAGGINCEGRVWLPFDAPIDWQSDIDRLDDVGVADTGEPLTELETYDALCATAQSDAATSATVTAGEVTHLYAPGAFAWLPPQFVATATAGTDAIICLERENVTLGICPGVAARVERFRESLEVTLVQYPDGGVITRSQFDGPFPQDCPSAAQTEELLYGAPVPRDTWAAWLIGRLRLVQGDSLRTVTLVPRLNARASSNTQSDILTVLEQNSPVNLIGRNEAGTWYVALLPDMTKAWLFAEFVSVAAQTPVEALPVVDGAASEAAIPIG